MTEGSPARRGMGRRSVLFGLASLGALAAACLQDGDDCTCHQPISATPTPEPEPTPDPCEEPPPPPPGGGEDDEGEGGRPQVRQPSAPTAEAFMAYAREMRDLAIAAGDHAYGAVIVMEGRVIGLGPSRVIVGTDPTAHAEIEAIRDAARRLGMRSLAGATLYSTSRPCRMCESAASYAHLSEFFFGDSLVAGGRPRSA